MDIVPVPVPEFPPETAEPVVSYPQLADIARSRATKQSPGFLLNCCSGQAIVVAYDSFGASLKKL